MGTSTRRETLSLPISGKLRVVGKRNIELLDILWDIAQVDVARPRGLS